MGTAASPFHLLRHARSRTQPSGDKRPGRASPPATLPAWTTLPPRPVTRGLRPVEITSQPTSHYGQLIELRRAREALARDGLQAARSELTSSSPRCSTWRPRPRASSSASTSESAATCRPRRAERESLHGVVEASLLTEQSYHVHILRQRAGRHHLPMDLDRHMRKPGKSVEPRLVEGGRLWVI